VGVHNANQSQLIGTICCSLSHMRGPLDAPPARSRANSRSRPRPRYRPRCGARPGSGIEVGFAAPGRSRWVSPVLLCYYHMVLLSLYIAMF